jgi:hypothetical protein
MRILELAIGIVLLGGAAWTTVRTYKGVVPLHSLFWLLQSFLSPWVCFFFLGPSELSSESLGLDPTGYDDESKLFLSQEPIELLFDYTVTFANSLFEL